MTADQCNGFWVGIDVAKDSFVASVADVGARPEHWARLRSRSFDSTPGGVRQFAAWVGKHTGSCEGICMESTGIYSKRLGLKLQALGLVQPSIVNPARVVAYAKSIGLRDKSDRVDAAVLALFGVFYRPAPKPPMSQAQQRLQALWRHREDILTQCKATQQRLEQTEERFVAKELKRMLKHYRSAMERVETEMQRVIEEDEQMFEDAQLIQTIPGVAHVTTWVVLAELGDLRQWKRNELVGFAGLYPREHSSGSSVYKKPRLARGGGGRLRKNLYMVATGIRSRPGPLFDYSERLIGTGKSKMCSIGAVMRKVLLVIRAVVVSGKPFDPAMIGGSK